MGCNSQVTGGYQRGHTVRMCESQAHATGRIIGECSLVPGGPRVTGFRSHLGAHCPATPQSWMGRLPVARSSSPATSRPQSGEGKDAGASGSAPRVSRNVTLLVLPEDPFFPVPHFSISAPLTLLIFPTLNLPNSSPPSPFTASSPNLLYHFHNLPSLQLQLVRLLRPVVEVHSAPCLRAPRFG